MSAFPDKAQIVIVGLGGIVGASVAHHLIERGWTDIVGIDKSGIPTDIGSTAHASDFCYSTSHDFLSTWTSLYSIDFFDRMETTSAAAASRWRAPATTPGWRRSGARSPRPRPSARARPRHANRDQGRVSADRGGSGPGRALRPRCRPCRAALAGRRRQARRRGRKTGALKAFANTPAKSLIVDGGRITGVVTHRGTIRADHVIVCAGLWGRLIANMVGEDLPVMPVDHPLTFFGPFTEFAGTGKDIGYPLMRDQGNSAYMRDTGDPKTTEGGQIEWGYYETDNPRLCHPRDLLEKEEA
ncbi:MAG: FAD-binding oxidoreductase, partial [Alphaproteobacteria bacterium]|nr:FAD-binding oxidoreductase [Alphaproteobacteria bacterium]